MARGLHGRGGACMVGGGACMVGEGHAWLGVCMAEGMLGGRGLCGSGGVRVRRHGYCSGRYASYWNAFLY